MSSFKIRQLSKVILVPERDEDHAMVNKCGERGEVDAFLATSKSGSGDEQSGEFALKRA